MLLQLPVGYYLDLDPDIVVLRRSDNSIVGKFSASGVDVEELRQAAETDMYQKPLSDKRSTTSSDTVWQESTLWVQFFGGFKVFCRGEVMPLGRSGNPLAILKHLLANTPPSLSQDYLMEWLWPEASSKRARWSLNAAIRALRRLLSYWTNVVPSSDVLVFENGHYRLSSSVKVVTDVEEFDAAYRRGLRLEKENRVDLAVAAYAKAAKLYRGDYLLQDQHEEWTLIERERLLSTYTDILTRLAVYYEERGQHQWAIQVCYELLKREPCHEQSYKRMMECYMRLGLRARALEQYRICARLLNSKYRTQPSSELATLYQRISNEDSDAGCSL